MIGRVHDHIVKELQQNTKTDIVFVITAIALNFISLMVNSSFAGNDYKSQSDVIILGILFALTILVNTASIIGLIKGKQTRKKLLDGLIRMYSDQGVEGYYDASLLSNYNTRYNMFIAVVSFIGFAAIAIPMTML